MYFFYHYDIRGSVTNIVRPDGTLIEGYTYDEFGNKVTTEYDENGNPILNPNNEKFKNEVTFTSSITDTSTGLQYMNARYYDSTTGRFLAQDTYSGNPYAPWTQHLYSYCGNNPVNFIDPTGHSASSIQAEIDELKKQRKIRITLRDNYAKNRWQYAEGSEMFDLLTGGWQRNKQIVKDLNVQIGKKQKELDTAMSLLQQQIKNNEYTSGDDAALGFFLQYQATSQSQNQEYGVVIYQKKDDGTYYLGKTHIGNSSRVIWVGAEAIGAQLAYGLTVTYGSYNAGILYGTLHTHPTAYLTIDPNNLNCGLSDGDRFLPGVRYLGSPDGVLYKSVYGGVSTAVYVGGAVSPTYPPLNPNGIPQVNVGDVSQYPNH